MKLINKNCSWWTALVMILIIIFSAVRNVYASGGEEMEGSELEKYLIQNGMEDTKGLFDGFEKMEYALFLETNIGYGVTGNYYRYGIYGDFVRTVREGERTYFELCEKMTGKKPFMETHEEWAENEAEYIYNISPDLCWGISRKYDPPRFYGNYVDTVIQKGIAVLEVESNDYDVNEVLQFKRTDTGEYELVGKESLKTVEQLVNEMWEDVYKWFMVNEMCMDEYGKMVAISESGNPIIRIYNIDNGKLVRQIAVPDIDPDFTLAISQFVGTEESGWLVFSNGNKTYRLNYPEGTLEQLGEFMFDTTYSPDGKYLAYCTGNIELYDKWMDWDDDNEKLNKINNIYAEWDEIPEGWYIKEIETGNTTFIPMETWEQDQRPLYGGRCVWIEKDKLLQILDQ